MLKIRIAAKLAADLGQHLAVGSHGLGQVLHHVGFTSCNRLIALGRRAVDSPLVSIMFAVLLADDSAHLADGLHTADQILLDVHKNTSKYEMND